MRARPNKRGGARAEAGAGHDRALLAVSKAASGGCTRPGLELLFHRPGLRVLGARRRGDRFSRSRVGTRARGSPVREVRPPLRVGVVATQERCLTTPRGS